MSSVERASVTATMSAVTASAVAVSRCSTGFVEDEDREVGDEGAGQREALALATRQSRAMLADGGVEPEGQRLHPVEEAGPSECVAELALGRLSSGQLEVLPQRGVEHVGVLLDEADDPPDVGALQVDGSTPVGSTPARVTEPAS